MARVLIFTGSTGGGHDQTAAVLRDAFEKRGDEVITMDLLSDFSLIVKFFVCTCYNFMFRHLPHLYGLMFAMSNNRIISSWVSSDSYFLLKRRLSKAVKHCNPDLIVSVHPFGSGILGRLRRSGRCHCPVIALITDFKTHWCHIGPCISGYVTSGELTSNTLIKKGIPKELIRSAGIPIRKEFTAKRERSYIDKKRYSVLLMAGSDGEMVIERAADQILACRNSIDLTIVCGKNKRTASRLEKKYSSQKERVKVLGFVKDIPGLMREADLFITKPGGISITEAVSQSLPVVIPFYIPGHEKDNTNFLVDAGLALYIPAHRLTTGLEGLLENPFILDRIRTNMEHGAVRYQVRDVLKAMDSICESSAERSMIIF